MLVHFQSSVFILLISIVWVNNHRGTDVILILFIKNWSDEWSETSSKKEWTRPIFVELNSGNTTKGMSKTSIEHFAGFMGTPS